MLKLNDFERKQFSQNGEDGITEMLVQLFYKDSKDKFYVEFGVEDGKECNTRILRTKYEWDGLCMDGSHEDKSINLQKEFITREGIVELFEKHNVPKHINYLCVDIDYNDFYVLKKILDSSYTCDIIVCEYNGVHSPTEDKVVKYRSNRMWDGSNYFGVSILTLTKLCNAHGYKLVACDKKGVNAFFVRDELVEKFPFANVNEIDKLYHTPKYGGGPNGGHPDDFKGREYLTFEEASAFDGEDTDEKESIVQNPIAKFNLPPDLKITYSIQVCNESRELFSLISFLLKTIGDFDNIHVVVDTLHVTDKVKKVLNHFGNIITVFERPFDNFYTNGDFHLQNATGDYIFGIDADEMPTEALVKNAKKIIQQSNSDLIFVPRMNIHPGITQDFINQSNGFFKLNEVEFVNWPDYQGKIFKKCDYIRFSNTTHCVAQGAKNTVHLQPNPKLGIWHIKSIEKQESRWSHADRYANVKPPDTSNLYDELM
jgi:hypothetical protein